MSSTVASGAGGAGGGGAGSSPYGIGGAGQTASGSDYGNSKQGQGGVCGNGGTTSSVVWIARGTVLQITIGGGGSGGANQFGDYYRNTAKPGSAGVVNIRG